MVADRAAVAGDAVAAAARAQLGVGHVRDRAQRAGAHGRGGDPRAVARRSIGGGLQVSSSASAASTSSTSSAPAHVRAADAELARRAQHVAERLRRAQR